VAFRFLYLTLFFVFTAEGNVRLYRNYDSPGELELASAFRAVTTTIPSSHPSGIITAWDQVAGHLYIAGDLDYVRVWDAHRELSQIVRSTRLVSFFSALARFTDLIPSHLTHRTSQLKLMLASRLFRSRRIRSRLSSLVSETDPFDSTTSDVHRIKHSLGRSGSTEHGFRMLRCSLEGIRWSRRGEPTRLSLSSSLPFLDPRR